ncbi:hypothetical protein [Nocardioides sp. J54]|uniref:hypothetical protein n=1 Tax=Nocardioides sp. J54 TaxID=935866 RepID=UPI00048BBBDC|nr:hypothetical protein [Nocardioides sp. J54]
MRRVTGAVVAALALVAGVLVGPATAAPSAVRIIDPPEFVPIDAVAQLLVAGLDESPPDGTPVAFAWDLDDDGQFDDASGDAALWNPALRATVGVGAYDVSVQAVVGGQQFVDTWTIHVIEQFKVSLGPDISVAVGDQVSIGATVSNFPFWSTRTYQWELDGDGDYDDAPPSAEYVTLDWTEPGIHLVGVRVGHDEQAPGALPAEATKRITVRIALATVSLPLRGRPGQTLTASGAAPAPTSATRTWTWLHDGTPIAVTNVPTYRLGKADAGRRVSVRVTATLDGKPSALPVTSGFVNVAALNLTRPSFTGTARVGRRLTARRGTWQAPGHTYAYQWLRNGKVVRGATRSTYTTTKADRGRRISVRVTARRSGFPAVRAVSQARSIGR